MKLQRTTLILFFLALGLGGFVYFREIQAPTQQQEAKEQKQEVFSFKEEQVQSFTVKTKNQTLVFERDKSSPTKWRMKSPVETPASDAAVSYLMDLLVRLKSDRTIQVPVAQLQEYELAQPQATIEVKLNNQNHQLILGKPDFNRNFLYAQADPPAKPANTVNVLLVSTDFENAVNRSLAEWQHQAQSPKKPSENTN